MATTAIALTLSLTSCASDSGEESTATSATETESGAATETEVAPTPTAPAEPVSYGTVTDLRDAAIASGYVCKNWKQSNTVSLAAESGTCDGESVLTTYASDADLQSQLDQEKSNAEMLTDAGIETTPVLVGPNWLLKAPEAPDLREALGGIVIGGRS